MENKEVSSAKPEAFSYIEGDKGSIDIVAVQDRFKKANLFFQLNEDSKSCEFELIAHKEGLYFAGIDYLESRMVERNGNRIDITDTCCPETINLYHKAVTLYDSNVSTIGDTTGWVTTVNEKPMNFSDEGWTTSGIFVFEVQ